MSLNGKVAIVTGGANGIGKKYVEGLAERGAQVCVADIEASAADDLVSQLNVSGPKHMAVKVDVSKEEEALRMVQVTHDRYGRIDILVNNAAIYSELKHQPWDAIRLEDWRRVLDVNLTGPYLCCRAVAPFMKRQRSGKIVNILSGTVWRGSPGRIHYTTSKAGLIGLTRVLARELGEYGICVNALAPGLTYTGRSQSPKEAFERTAQERCFRRIEYPEDLVGPLLFLVAGESDFITGQILNVDGGGHQH